MRVDTDRQASLDYARNLGRAFAGAVIFSLPLMMTMEMWRLGFYLDPLRLLQFLAVNFVVVVGLSRLSGFEPTVDWYDDLMDAFAAYGIAFLASAAALALFGIIMPDMPMSEIVGKIAIQMVPASIGATLASKQLGGGGDDDKETERERDTYCGQLFLMFAGALFLSLSVAPTEEIVLISYRMSVFHAVALIAASIAMLHALVYSVGLRGTEDPSGHGPWSTFLRFSIVGYGIAVVAAAYVLWSFGRIDSVSLPHMASVVAVLAFPGAVGAAIARLVI